MYHAYIASTLSRPMPLKEAYALGQLLHAFFPADQLTGLAFLVDRDNLVSVGIFVDGIHAEDACLDHQSYPLRFIGNGYPFFAAWLAAITKKGGTK